MLACLLGVAAQNQAHAQSCHAASLREDAGASLRANVSGLFATYQNAQYTGEYQGLRALAAFMSPWLYGQVTLPVYRLVRNGLAEQGMGDAGTNLRVTALRMADGRLTLGPELAATFPSGDAARDLGMGHVMVMPGLWLRLELAGLSVSAQLAYGHSVQALGAGASGHHHHGGTGPLVNPMNASELEHALGVAYALHDALRVTGRVLGAVPVAVKAGQAREIVAVGVQAIAGPFDAAVEVELPVVGNPFLTRTLLSVGAQW